VQRLEQRAPRVLLAVGLACGALASACTAQISSDRDQAGNASAPSFPSGGSASGGSSSGEPLPTPPVTALPAAQACKSNSPGPRALRRLTAAEYSSTLKDLFGDASVPLTSVFNDPTVLGFAVDSHSLVVRDLGAQQLMDQAESVAHWAVTTHLDKLSSCSSMDASCRQSFIRNFGKRAHRAPLSDEDVAVYEKLFSAEANFADGAEAVTSAMLQSPYFLYRRELGTTGADGFQLSPYELASSLSYLLTGTMPDDQLLAAADSGALAQPAELERQAERLLQSAPGHQAVEAFLSGWLGFGKLDTVAKDDSVFLLTPSLRKAMGGETKRFIEDAVFTQKGSFSTLLTAKTSFVNQELASHYGLKSAASFGDQLTAVTFDPSERDGGILAQGSLLTSLAGARESSPVQRGKMVRVRLLCQDLQPPPAGLDTTLKPPPPNATTREHYAAHSTNPVCAGCHTKMDPIGFGFEHYDAFGRRREQDQGKPVDSTGTVFASPAGQDVNFDGVSGLTNYLTQDAADNVNACIVRYWSYFAFGSPGWAEDQCTYDSISEQAKLDGFALQSVVKAIVKTARFSRRVADP